MGSRWKKASSNESETEGPQKNRNREIAIFHPEGQQDKDLNRERRETHERLKQRKKC
jgi:hypothetical protein